MSFAVVVIVSGLVGLASMVAWPGAAQATIVGITDNRVVKIATDPGFPSPAATYPTSDFADFSRTLGTAGYIEQNSSITEDQLKAVGEAVADMNGNTVGSSLFEIDFEVTSTLGFELSGFVDASTGNIATPTPDNAGVSLLADGTELFSEDGEGGPFFFDGQLQPGVVYTLSAFAESTGNAYDNASYNVDFLVPEASSVQLALAGLATLGLLAVRRRHAPGACARA